MSRMKDELRLQLAWSRARAEEEFYQCPPVGLTSISRPESGRGPASGRASPPRADPMHPRPATAASSTRKAQSAAFGCNMVETRIRGSPRPYSAVFSTSNKPNTPMQHRRPNPELVQQQLQSMAETHLRGSQINWLGVVLDKSKKQAQGADAEESSHPHDIITSMPTGFSQRPQTVPVKPGQGFTGTASKAQVHPGQLASFSPLALTPTTPQQHGPRPHTSAPQRGSKQALVQELQALTARTGQKFYAVDSNLSRPASAPQGGFVMHWERQQHTNKVSKLLRLGDEPNHPPDSGSDSGSDPGHTSSTLSRGSMDAPAAPGWGPGRSSSRQLGGPGGTSRSRSPGQGGRISAGGEAQQPREHSVMSLSGSQAHQHHHEDLVPRMRTEQLINTVLAAAEQQVADSRLQQAFVEEQLQRVQHPGAALRSHLQLSIPADTATAAADKSMEPPPAPEAPSVSRGGSKVTAICDRVSPKGRRSASPIRSQAAINLMNKIAALSGKPVLQQEVAAASDLKQDRDRLFRRKSDEHLKRALAAVAARDQEEVEKRLQEQREREAAAAAAAARLRKEQDEDDEGEAGDTSLSDTESEADVPSNRRKIDRMKTQSPINLTPRLLFAEDMVSAYAKVDFNHSYDDQDSPTGSHIHSHHPDHSHDLRALRSQPSFGLNLTQRVSMWCTSSRRGLRSQASFATRSVLDLEAELMGGDLETRATAALQRGLLEDMDAHQGDNEADDDTAYKHQLAKLKREESIAPPEDEPVTRMNTYTGLFKPNRNSASCAAQLNHADGWDPSHTLNWSGRGVTARKLPDLQRMLLANASTITALQLSGNTLDNASIKDLLVILSRTDAPPVSQLDISMNPALTWQVTSVLALALGCPAGDDTEKSLLSIEVRPLKLRRLVLSGIKLADRGAAQLGQALQYSRTLRELNVSRCGITESGGRALFEPLATNHYLHCVDVSWNAMSGDAATALQLSLTSNCSLQRLILNNNGFSDLDAARILSGLEHHGHWRHVDLSNNNVGSGAMLVFTRLCEAMTQAASRAIARQHYTIMWEEEVMAGTCDTSTWYLPDGVEPASSSRPSSPYRPASAMPQGRRASAGPVRPTSPSPPDMEGRGGASPDMKRADHHLVPPMAGKAAELGRQLVEGPVLLQLDGCPVGWAGTRLILSALDSMSHGLDQAVEQSHASDPYGPLTPDLPAPWPLYVTLSGCNVTLSDSLPHDMKTGEAPPGMDLNSPNVFLSSLMTCVQEPQAAGKGKGKGKKSDKKKSGSDSKKGKKGKDSGSGPRADYFFTQSSQSLNLFSPAGKYRLDLAHPGSAVLINAILRVSAMVKEALDKQLMDAGEAKFALKDLQLNGKPLSEDKLPSLVGTAEQGVLSFVCSTSSLLATGQPAALTDAVVGWLVDSIMQGEGRDLFKLNFIEVAASSFFFTPAQAMVVYDPDMGSSERLRAIVQLYSKCLNPCEFWEQVLAALTPMEAAPLRAHLSEVGALDILRPCGRYNLNLSRMLDRLIATRLQEAACVERAWQHHKYFLNWRNATLGGLPLDLDALGSKLRDLTMPVIGNLKLDFVSYKRPSPDEVAADEDAFRELMRVVRMVHKEYRKAMLQAQLEYLPHGLTRSGLAESAERAAAQAKFRARMASGNQRRSMVAKELTRKLKDMAMELAAVSAVADEVTDKTDEAGGDIQEPKPVVFWWADTGFDAQEVLSWLQAPAATDSPAAIESAPPSPSKGGDKKSKKGKETKKKSGAKTGKGKEPGKQARPAPNARFPGLCLAEDELQIAQVLAARLLSIPHLQAAAMLLSRCASKHVARAMGAIISSDASLGPKVCAKLIEAMPPVSAVYILYEVCDSHLPVLPPAVRAPILGALRADVLRQLDIVQREVNSLVLKRMRHIQHAINLFAHHNAVNSQQIMRILKYLKWEQDRVTTCVTLWGRCVDGSGLYDVYRSLAFNEQRQVLNRLGYWYVWSGLKGRPEGLHWSLDITDPEQRDVAKEIVRSAVQDTAKAKEAAKKSGNSSAAQHLNHLMGNGFPLSIPEDEKAWSMLESSYQNLEFEYADTPAQIAAAEHASIRHIQASWRYTVAIRRALAAQEAAERQAEADEAAAEAAAEDALRVQASALLKARKLLKKKAG